MTLISLINTSFKFKTANIKSSKRRMKSTSFFIKNNMSLYFKASRIQWSRRMRRTMMFLNRTPCPILFQSIQAARKDGEEDEEED